MYILMYVHLKPNNNTDNTEDLYRAHIHPAGCSRRESRNTGGKPLLFHDKCPGFFYVHYTTHGTYSFTSHPKDEAIMVKCLAQGHTRRDRPGRDSNPHSGNTRTWVQCTRPLGHNTPRVPGSKISHRWTALFMTVRQYSCHKAYYWNETTNDNDLGPIS